MWISWSVLGIIITNIAADVSLSNDDPSYASWDKPKHKYDNFSFMSILPNPDHSRSFNLGAWNSSISNDFDNIIPTFEYTNSSGDLASAASDYGPGTVSRGYAAGRQDGADYSRAYMPLITYFDVKCDKSGMHVHVEFNKPFNGIIFSKGFFNSANCRYVPAKSYGKIFDFTVPVDYCGTAGEDHSYDYKDTYYENTIIIQFDEYIQEVWDLAKTIRCEWNAYYDKSVAVRPFNVGNLDPVLYRFNGDNIETWIQVQKGKGPWAEEVYGIVKVGDPLTVVIGIRDKDGKFDMQVKDCFATDGYGGRVQLTDYYGCVVRDKIMSPFQKVKDYGSQATVVSYAYFQAFKFPDRYEVGIKCNIQVCLGKCQGGCPGDYSGGNYQKSKGTYPASSDPGYPPPPAYGPAPGGAYSSVVPTQKIDTSQFGTGPYVPDVPPPAQGAPPYQGSYDTDHAIGLDSSAPVPAESREHDVTPNIFGGASDKKTGNGPALDPYRRKRSMTGSNGTEEAKTASTATTATTTTTTVIEPVQNSTTKIPPTTLKFGRNSGRIAKIVLDDGQINLNGKFKVIASHDIQSDNIHAGPQEVSPMATNSICMTVPSFTVGITLLVAILILSILVTFFACFRLRKYTQKSSDANVHAPIPRREVRKTRLGDFLHGSTCWSPPLTVAVASHS